MDSNTNHEFSHRSLHIYNKKSYFDNRVFINVSCDYQYSSPFMSMHCFIKNEKGKLKIKAAPTQIGSQPMPQTLF